MPNGDAVCQRAPAGSFRISVIPLCTLGPAEEELVKRVNECEVVVYNDNCHAFGGNDPVLEVQTK